MKNTVRYWREQRGYSQAELAGMIDVRVQTIWNIEHAKHKPRMSTLRKLAEALGVTRDQLFSDSDDEKPAA